MPRALDTERAFIAKGVTIAKEWQKNEELVKETMEKLITHLETTTFSHIKGKNKEIFNMVTKILIAWYEKKDGSGSSFGKCFKEDKGLIVFVTTSSDKTGESKLNIATRNAMSTKRIRIYEKFAAIMEEPWTNPNEKKAKPSSTKEWTDAVPPAKEADSRYHSPYLLFSESASFSERGSIWAAAALSPFFSARDSVTVKLNKARGSTTQPKRSGAGGGAARGTARGAARGAARGGGVPSPPASPPKQLNREVAQELKAAEAAKVEEGSLIYIVSEKCNSDADKVRMYEMFLAQPVGKEAFAKWAPEAPKAKRGLSAMAVADPAEKKKQKLMQWVEVIKID